MILEEKKEYILNRLNEVYILKIKDLSRELYCTDASIRQIVNSLAKKKLLKRIHGGVSKNSKLVSEVSEKILLTKNVEEKEYIANIALKFITDNKTIILSSGTTNLMLAKKIKNFNNLNIITNSIKIAYTLSDNPSLNIIILGGVLRHLTSSIIKYHDDNMLKNLNADILFLSTGAVSIENGITDPNIQEAKMNKELISAAKKIILLADSSKISRVALALVDNFNKIDTLITDNKVDPNFVKKARELGVEVLF